MDFITGGSVVMDYRLVFYPEAMVYRDSSPKNDISVINYSPSCPVRPSFIFRTQIKIFLMQSESYQTLHRQQHN